MLSQGLLIRRRVLLHASARQDVEHSVVTLVVRVIIDKASVFGHCQFDTLSLPPSDGSTRPSSTLEVKCNASPFPTDTIVQNGADNPCTPPSRWPAST